MLEMEFQLVWHFGLKVGFKSELYANSWWNWQCWSSSRHEFLIQNFCNWLFITYKWIIETLLIGESGDGVGKFYENRVGSGKISNDLVGIGVGEVRNFQYNFGNLKQKSKFQSHLYLDQCFNFAKIETLYLISKFNEKLIRDLVIEAIN